MIGQKLHKFDVALCQYSLNNIAGYLGRPAFAAFVERFDPAVANYLRGLAGDDEPQLLLLTDADLDDLADAFEGGPLEFDREWVPNVPLHRRAIDCVPEIRAALTEACAEEWVQASSRFARHLETDIFLSEGIAIVHDWVREARRLLRAMGAAAHLPRPEGTFPTPANPEPSNQEEKSQKGVASNGLESGNSVLAAIAQTEALQREVRDLLLQQKTVRDWYSTDEIAGQLGKDPFTVREWCRRGRVNAVKKGSGRGKHQFWVISHEELLRIQREGLLPVARV